jgi:hypothetical protein
MVILNAHAAATFTKDPISLHLFIQHLQQPEPPRILDDSGVLRVT